MPEIAIPMLLLDHIEPTEPANSLLGGLEPLAWKPLQRAAERESSESGLLLRPSFMSGGMAVERAAQWATPAGSSSIPAAVDEKADLAVARLGFSELQS